MHRYRSLYFFLVLVGVGFVFAALYVSAAKCITPFKVAGRHQFPTADKPGANSEHS